MTQETRKQTASPILAQTTPESNAFSALLRTYESNPTESNLLSLARAVTFSVLKKVIDPQRKTAADRDAVSNNGYNPALVALRRSIVADTAALDALHTAANKATKATYTADGQPVTVTADADAENTVDVLISETLGDGLDLVHAAAVAILEQAADHAGNGEKWLETPYAVRRLSRRVYIQTAESAAFETVETTPIQEIFSAVRREIQNSRAVQTDSRNGYSYIAETAADPESDALETIYRRLGKYTDLGGYQTAADYRTAGAPDGMTHSGADLYTTDAAAVADYYSIIERLNMTDRQAEIVRLRMQGYGVRAIASKLGVKFQTVQVQLARLQNKLTAAGYTPNGYTVNK